MYWRWVSDTQILITVTVDEGKKFTHYLNFTVCFYRIETKTNQQSFLKRVPHTQNFITFISKSGKFAKHYTDPVAPPVHTLVLVVIYYVWRRLAMYPFEKFLGWSGFEPRPNRFWRKRVQIPINPEFESIMIIVIIYCHRLRLSVIDWLLLW